MKATSDCLHQEPNPDCGSGFFQPIIVATFQKYVNGTESRIYNIVNVFNNLLI